ncbi:MAG: hypothetical protein FJ138_11120 [Deltaproteobacteria bacterium]|nr:hypothetical protein [Deltaproteobacteria bacterium]
MSASLPKTQGTPHPVIYQPAALPTPSCLSPLDAEVPAPLTLPLDPAAPPPSAARLSYERVLSWAALDGHGGYQGAKRLDLERYRAQAQTPVRQMCGGCHSAAGLARDGFCVQAEPQGPSDLHLLAPLVNHLSVDDSALIGFLEGQFDHIPLNKTPEQVEAFRQAIRAWVAGQP